MCSDNAATKIMMRGKKVRLLPTPRQEELFWKSAGTARWAHNYYLGRQEETYQAYLKNGKTGPRYITEGDIRKEINNHLKPTTHTWLKEVGSNVMKQAVKSADKALKKFLRGMSGRPKYKSKHRSKPSFYVNYESLRRRNGGFHGEADRPKGGSYTQGYRHAGYFIAWVTEHIDRHFLRKLNRSCLEVVPWSWDGAVRFALGPEYDIDSLWQQYQLAMGDTTAE